jgi:cytochrome c-L
MDPPMRHLALAALLLVPLPAAAEVEFRHALDDAPLPLDLRPEQTLTEAVERFRETGENPYGGDAEAIAAGEETYARLCQSCHLADGSGRIGPNLSDDEWQRERTDTEVGRFEIIYGGGAGSMQAFGQRLDQDEILKVMAFIDTLRAADG